MAVDDNKQFALTEWLFLDGFPNNILTGSRLRLTNRCLATTARGYTNGLVQADVMNIHEH